MKEEKQAEEPLYYGHRARLRERFLSNEGDGMPDYELLELLLTFSIPRRDVKPLAKKLIKKYKNIDGVINAPFEELSEFKGVSQTTAVWLKIVEEQKKRAASRKMASRNEEIFRNWLDLAVFARTQISKDEEQTIYAFYFDAQNYYLDKRKIVNSDDYAALNRAVIVEDINRLNATAAAIIHHNPADIEYSWLKSHSVCVEIEKFLLLFDTKFLDFLLLDKNCTLSSRHVGLLRKIDEMDN